MQKPLVSVIILAYNNFRYLFEAVDSALGQDYPRLELIINHDAGKDFDEAAVKQYIKAKRGKNLENFIVLNNKVNLGTVKSINNAIRAAEGELINFFAADDVVYDKRVISRFVKAFEQLPKSELIVTAQLGMYDLRMKKLIQPFLSKADIELLHTLKPKKLFAEMATRCLVAAASTCYKKALFEKYGYFDERYRLVEDWSSALKFSRLGIKFNYADFIAFKHRDGGISHGNLDGEKRLNKHYDLDILNIMKYEVKPYLHLLNKKQQRKFSDWHQDHKWKFTYRYLFANKSKSEVRQLIFNNLNFILLSSYRDLKSYLIDQIEGKKFKIFLAGVFLLALYVIGIDYFSHLFFLHQLAKVFSLALIASSIFLTVFQMSKIFLPKIFRLILKLI